MCIRKSVKRVFNSALAVFLAIVMVLLSVPYDAQAAADKSSVSVSTQVQLAKALANKSIRTITIKTANVVKFTVSNKNYTSKTLVISSAKATVSNGGILKKLIVTDALTVIENAKGNSITVNDTKLNINVAKNAEVKDITFDMKNANYSIVSDGNIKKMIIARKAAAALSGKTVKRTAVLIRAEAKGAGVTASIPVDVTTAADTDIFLKKGAENSTVTSAAKEISLKVENKTTKSVKLATPEEKRNITAGTTFTTKKPTVSPAPTTVPSLTPTVTPSPTPTATPSPTPTLTPYFERDGITKYYTVTYNTDGGISIPSAQVANGCSFSSLPVPQKNGSIFLGWYTDKEYQNKFEEGTAVYSNLTLYARYSEIEMEAPEFLDNTFALSDQKPDLSFTVVTTDKAITAADVKNALTLQAIDGSEAMELTVTGSNGTFTVAAQNGFKEGAAYTLTLDNDALSFKDHGQAVRICSFNIAKKEVYNIEFNKDIVYIPDSEVSGITKNGTAVKELSVPVADLSDSENSNVSAGGTFTYTGSTGLNVGDVLCVYSGVKPTAPDSAADDAAYMDESIAYVKVVSVTGSIGSQSVEYSDAEADEVLSMPEILPVSIGDTSTVTNYTTATDSTAGSFTIQATDLDFSKFSDMGLSEKTAVNIGDYLALYTGDISARDGKVSIIYGKVTGVSEEDGKVSVCFTTTTMDKIMESGMDYYSRNDVNADILLEDVDIAAVKEQVIQQVEESGFAEKSSGYLAALAVETDGFREMAGENVDLASLSVQMSDGTSAKLSEIAGLSAAAKENASSSKTVKISNLLIQPEIGTGLKKLTGSGVRCAVKVSFDVAIEVSKDNVINVTLSATFVEELKMSVDTSGDIINDGSWYWPKVDYKVDATMDVYDYTGVEFKAVITSRNTQAIDISGEIQKILSYTDPKQITSGVEELFELYGDMMENETDWIELLKYNIVKSQIKLLGGIIQIQTTVDFVVNANINVAIGCSFEYKSGTSYTFWAKLRAREGGNGSRELMDKEYSFMFYVLGTLGLRAGINLEFAVGLFSLDLDSVGLTAEAGVYLQLYGYFYYQYKSVNKVSASTMAGALYVEVGIYAEAAFKAQVFGGSLQYNPTLYENTWPLLTYGSKENVYDFAYQPQTSVIRMKDPVRSYELPNSYFDMACLDLVEGNLYTKNMNYTRQFIVTFKDKLHFAFDGKNVLVPNLYRDVHKLESDMTITWGGAPLAFSSVPISRTFHVVWDNINDNGYTVSYNSNGGSVVNSAIWKYEETVTAPAAPVKTGYTFGGWYADAQLKNAYAFSTSKMPADNIVLYAKWVPLTNTVYKVEHYLQNVENDNFALYETEAFTGTTDSIVSGKAKTYTGFRYAPSVYGSLYTAAVAADGRLVLKMYYVRNNYVAYFRTESTGNYNTTQVIARYGAAFAPPVFTKNGYTFAGWNKTVPSTMPAWDQNALTFSATWAAATYTISFNTNGGNDFGKITQACGTKYVMPQPTKLGYYFNGWYSDSALTKPYYYDSRSTMPAMNLTLYAKWRAANDTPYKVEFYKQNASGTGYTLAETALRQGTTGAKVSVVGTNIYTGFTYNSSAAGNITTGEVKADGSLALKLYYDRNNYTISFNSNGGSDVTAITQRYGSTVVKPADPVKTGYSFNGWYSDAALNTAYTFATMPVKNITLYVKWIPGTNTAYKVEHYQQNASDTGYTLKETEKLAGTTDATVTAVAKTYDGFAYNSSAAGSIAAGAIKADGSLMLKLYYDRNNCTISFNSNGGSNVAAITQKYGSAVTKPAADPVKTGYSFNGWCSDAALSAVYSFTTMPAKDITLYARWKPNTNTAYKVEHYQQNESGTGYALKETENLTGTTDATATATAKTYEGFTYNSSATGSISTGAIKADGSLTLKLYYDRKSFTISFNSNGGSSVTGITQKYGSTVSKPGDPVMEGYVFDAWYSDAGLATAYTFSTMPAKDITLYAKWKPGTNTAYIVQHYQQNASDNSYTLKDTDSLTGTTGTTATAAAKTYNGFTYNNSAVGTVGSGVVAANGTLVLKLYYDRNTYTISFNSNGGDSVSNLTQKYGATVRKPADPAKTGYSFGGWYSDAALNNAYVFSTMPAEDITLYVKWNANANTAYKVVHYLQNESGTSYTEIDTENLTGTTGATATANAKTYDGFIFDDKVSGTIASGVIAADGSLILKLYYCYNTYTISFNSNGGSSVTAISLKYNAAVTKPTDPAKTGYSFGGWYSDEALNNAYTFSNATMPAKDFTLYAKWNPNTDTAYKVIHYQQDVSGTGYSEKETEKPHRNNWYHSNGNRENL